MKASHLSQEHLTELKSRLEESLQETKKQLDELRVQDPFQDPDHTSDNADSGSESREEDGHDRIQAQVDQLTAQQALVEKALAKMADGSYGICEVTGQEIPVERLLAMPTATTIVTA